jgi:elongation factor Ts
MGKIGVLVAEARLRRDAQCTGQADRDAHRRGKTAGSRRRGSRPADRARARDRNRESQGKRQAGNIVEKMVEGLLPSSARSPLSQLFVIDNKTPVADVVAQAGKDAGSPIAEGV